GHVAMAEDFVATDLVESLPEAFDQIDLVAMDLGETLICDILDPGRQPGDAENIGSSAFEEVRIVARLCFAGGITAGAALAPGADDGGWTNVESTGAGWAQQRLVAREGEQID